MISQILDVFQNFRMAPTPNDQYELVGKQALAHKINKFISLNKPIEFVMLGFPMKSMNNRDKVIGTLPDLAEEVAIKNFDTFNEKIKEVYAPGVINTIVSDGYAFSELMGISDNTVREYGDMCIDMAGPSMKFHDIRDFYNSKYTIDEMREKVLQDWGITEDELQKRILTDPDVNYLYRGMIKFLTLDLAIKDYPSGNQLQKAAKKLAREMMFMNEAYSHLIAYEFRNHIRLSMHPSINNGVKYSFQLILSPRAWTSPWHCALSVDKDGIMSTIHRKDATHHELVYKDNRPYYFQEL